jgi:hypothetical protein
MMNTRRTFIAMNDHFIDHSTRAHSDDGRDWRRPRDADCPFHCRSEFSDDFASVDAANGSPGAEVHVLRDEANRTII